MSGGANFYDFTRYRDYPFELVDYFIQNPDNQKLFSFNQDIPFNKQYLETLRSLYDSFMWPEVHLVEALLEEKVNIMVYNGQNDLCVATPGTFKWVELLQHPFADQFRYVLLYAGTRSFSRGR
jgi:hypothetical protein